MEVVAIMAQMLSFHFQRMEQKRHGSCLHIIVDLGVVEFVSGGLDIVWFGCFGRFSEKDVV